jgi:hypothetical protein
MSNSIYKGTLDNEAWQRFQQGPAAREAMDDQIRRRFKIPDDRYYTVTLPPGPAGQVFLDTGRTRPPQVHKISKSDQDHD